jgi:hypothetical protein
MPNENLNAFPFGKKGNSADSAGPPKIVEGDITTAINVSRDLKSKCATIRGKMTTTASKISKFIANPKTFTESSDIATPQFIENIISSIGGYFDNLSISFGKISDGFNSVKKSKKSGDVNEVSGIKLISNGIMMLEASPVFLAGIRANIALLSKLITSRRKQKITNSGEIESALRDLIASIGEKKKIIGSTKDLKMLIADFFSCIEGLEIRDKNLNKLFKNAEQDIGSCKELIETICQFLDSTIKIFSNDKSELIELGKTCEDILDGDDDSDNRGGRNSRSSRGGRDDYSGEADDDDGDNDDE